MRSLTLIAVGDKSRFSERLKQAFDDARNKDIAELLGVSRATITLYTSGHLPPPDVLLKISEKTRCNLHWLLTGSGPRWAPPENAEEKKEAKVIALYHGGAGGTGTSTAAVFISMSLARRGYRTLLVQPYDESIPSWLLFPDSKEDLFSIRGRPDIFPGRYPSEAPNLIFKTSVDGLDINVSNERERSRLLELEVNHFSPLPSEFYHLYSFIVVDTKTFGLLDMFDLLKARLVMSAKVLISCDPSRYEAAIHTTLSSLARQQDQSDEIEILGAFSNLADQKRHHAADLMNEIRRLLPGKVLKTVIHRDQTYRRALANGQGALNLGAKAAIVQEYDRLTDEALLFGKNCKGW
jgi:cellulose biosynthesis protein BcsQ